MSLQKNKLDILFTEGINSKVDPKVLPQGSLESLENRVFIKAGAVDKRKGFNRLANTDCLESSISNMDALSVFDDKEMVLFADSNLYSYSTPLDKWVSKDTVLSASVEIDSIVSNAKQQENFDMCTANGVSLVAWEQDGELLYSVRDVNSGSFFVQNQVVSATGDSPRCLALGNTLAVFYGDGTDLKFLSVSATIPCGAAGTGTISTDYEDLHTDHIIDVTKVGLTGYIFYKGTTASTVQQLEINTSGAVISDSTVTATVVDCLSVSAYTASDSVAYLNLAYKETASVIKAGIYNANMVVKSALQTIDSATTDISNITLAQRNNSDSVRIYYTTASDGVRSNTLDLDGTVGTAAQFLRQVSIVSNAFNNGDTLLINVLYESDLQATVFTVNESGEVVTVLSKGQAGSASALHAPTNVEQLANEEFIFVMNTKGVIRSENATLFSLLGLSMAKLDFRGPNLYNSTTLNSNLYAVGGLLNVYDGQYITEQGFHLFPEGVAAGTNSASGGSMSDGTYLYYAVYQWIDNKGNIHRSAPSIALSATTNAGGSSQTQDIDVPTLPITQKTGARGEVTIELYRTEDAGTIPYKVTSVSSPEFNDLTVDTVTITDTLADSSIISNEILYTTGDVLENIAAPSCDIVTSHTNRLFIAGLQDKNEIRYSKIVRRGEGVAFNELLSIQIDPTGGEITNLASMDANLIVFKRDNIYRVGGEGLNDTGQDSTLTEPELISSDVGCVDGNSVVLGPQGLFFKSAKGIYLLDRSLQAQYIGANVEDFNSETITSANLLDDVNEVRFTTDGGNILVYNYYFGQWSTFTNYTVDDALVFNNAYTFIDDNDNVWQEYNGYKDNGGFVNSKITTPWIKVSGIQGFQRVYKVAILGDFRSKHMLKMTIYNDYSVIPVQEHMFDVSSILSANSGFYGDGVYGSDNYGTDNSDVYQFELHMKKQKCQAVRVEIEDIFSNADNDGSGEGAAITGLTLEIGSKRGVNKNLGEGRKG